MGAEQLGAGGAELFWFNEERERRRGKPTISDPETLYEKARREFADPKRGKEDDSKLSDEERAAKEISRQKLDAERAIHRERTIADVRACVAAGYLPLPDALQVIKSLSAAPLRESFDIGKASYQNEGEMKELLGPEYSDRFMHSIMRAEIDSLSIHGTWSKRILDHSSAITDARISGVETKQIITAEDIRMALATERVYMAMNRIIPQARSKVSAIVANLNAHNPGGVKSGPFLQAVEQLSQLGDAVTTRLDKMSRMARFIAGDTGSPQAQEVSTELSGLLQQARAIFDSFTGEGYIITMDQIGRLQRIMSASEQYYATVTPHISSGHQQVKYNSAIGNHEEVRRIEAGMDLPRRDVALKALISALRTGFDVHLLVTAYEAYKSGALLKSLPPSALAEARRASGLPASSEEDEKNLVLPAHDDLESR